MIVVAGALLAGSLGGKAEGRRRRAAWTGTLGAPVRATQEAADERVCIAFPYHKVYCEGVFYSRQRRGASICSVPTILGSSPWETCQLESQ